MGKRKAKARKPAGPKKREPLATSFTCLFCNHEKSIQVKMNKKEGIGELSCKTCGQHFQTTINYLSAAVDVYSDWIDACEAVAHTAVDDEQRITREDREFSKYADGPPTRGAEDEEEVDAAYDDDY